MKRSFLISVVLLVVLTRSVTFAQENAYWNAIDKKVTEMMNDGDIPGLSLVIVDRSQTHIRCYGEADTESGRPVDAHTLFELGSCSKAFTALAVLHLFKEKNLSLDTHVSEFIPWLTLRYQDSIQQITIRQLLHHTSGIPWQTISKIPESIDTDALERTVRTLCGQELHHGPGEIYEYATINYDVLALVVQNLSGKSFEEYLSVNILKSLGLSHTTIGEPWSQDVVSKGHKIGFFSPIAYEAPRFKGNNAAGYVITDAADLAVWLRFQLGWNRNELTSIMLESQQRDESVSPHGMYYYGMGWETVLDGSGTISHSGLNPTFSSFISLNRTDSVGVAAIANSNSEYTSAINTTVAAMLTKRKNKPFYADGGYDKPFTLISLLLAAYVTALTFFLYYRVRAIVRNKSQFLGFRRVRIRQVLLTALLVGSFTSGLYLLPEAIFGFDWSAILVWAPVSFHAAVALLLVATVATLAALFITTFFATNNRYFQSIPVVLLLSFLSGLANMALIILITSSIGSDFHVGYLLFYYLLTVVVYLLTRRYVQVRIITISRELTYDLTARIIQALISIPYRKFEKLDRGRIYTALNDDVEVLGQLTNTIIVLITSAITAIGVFFYLATIAFWATGISIFLIGGIVTAYYFACRGSDGMLREARDTRNRFTRATSDLIDGFKELTLRRARRDEYQSDLLTTAGTFKEKVTQASVGFANAFMIGESMLIVTLGLVVFGFERLFPEIQSATIMAFVIVFLYLIGPINSILGAVPGVMQIRIAWDRINAFLRDVEHQSDVSTKYSTPMKVDSIAMEDVVFHYADENNRRIFSVGPLNFRLKRGEVMFVTGGNGSGKTTLAKVLLGFYTPRAGAVKINGQQISATDLGEYFSAVFNPNVLFEKIYAIDTSTRRGEINQLLKELRLDTKVNIEGGRFSTTDLSSGERKRLALMLCYLEDAPILLFDEWAADQDPEFRRIFYHKIIPELRMRGKIVIAITHDDSYFDAADHIMKLDMGKMTLHYNVQDRLSQIHRNYDPT
jgi:putative pyoverdin transport system ATP-binding/permease protein